MPRAGFQDFQPLVKSELFTFAVEANSLATTDPIGGGKSSTQIADPAVREFDLNVEAIEWFGSVQQINLTDGGCDPTCPQSYVSAIN